MPFAVWNDNGNYYCIDGHTRKQVLLELINDGVEVPTQLKAFEILAKDRTEAIKILVEVYNQKHNPFAEEILTEWLEAEEIEVEDLSLESVNISINEKQSVLNNIEEDDFEFNESVETDIVLGDLFEIGNHRLLCGDSTNFNDVEKLMNGEKADITFTSPPYNVGKTPNGNSQKYLNDSDDKDTNDYVEFLDDFTKNALLFSDYVFSNIQSLSGNKISLIEHLYNLRSVYADVMIWDKLTAEPAMARRVLNSRFEYIYIFSNEAKRSVGKKDFRGTIDNIFCLNSRQQKEFSDIHKATFPVLLPAFFIENFTENSVLDLFLGTGSTMVAAHQSNRKCFGMELSPIYCEVIIQRMLKLDPTLTIKRNGIEETKWLNKKIE